MRRLHVLSFVVAGLVSACGIVATEDGVGARDKALLFDGRSLQGWINVNGHPDTWRVEDGMLVTTGVPISFLRSDRMYENFVLEFEWKHEPRSDGKHGNAGLFVWSDPIPAVSQGLFPRAVEVQVLVGLEKRDEATGAVTATSHGDVFSIWGASCVPDRPHPLGWPRSLPLENRAHGFGEWNHYRVTAKDGAIRLAVNGKEVSGVSQCVPRKGYLAFEAEGNPISFRNIRILELPSSHPAQAQIAMDGVGWEGLYNRRDLSGWRADAQHIGHWRAANWRLAYDGKSTAGDRNLWTSKEYGDFELIADWRLVGTRSLDRRDDGGISLRGSRGTRVAIPASAAGKLEEWNRYHITVRGDRLTAVVNGATLIDGAQLADVPARGPIGLQVQGDPIEFANLYIRELPPAHQ